MDNIIDLLISKLNSEGLWFTTKADPTFEEPSSYYKLDEYGDLTEASVKKIEKEIKSLIGDGAVDINEAIDVWVNDAVLAFTIDFKENLVTKFKDKQVVDQIEAYENSIQLGESKKITENEDRIKVIFRKELEDGDIIAVFPELPSNEDMMVCYAHIGQHSEMSLGYYNENTIPATPKEYKDLKAELENIVGYSLEVVTELSESKKVNFNVCTKDIKVENVQRRLAEENNKSANLISDMFKSKDFDSDSKAGQIVMRTSTLFNVLSDRGYDVQVAFDNGESTNSILLGQQGGQVIITITNTDQPLRAFTSGNFEINDENIKILTDIQSQIETL